jgi:hypothetical protein
MVKVITTLALLAAFAVVNFGCHASADVDPHGSTNVTLPH